jgi:hypothetical protein
MRLRLRHAEDLDLRVLAAVSFVDAGTRERIGRALAVSAAGVRWLRNRSNLYVCASAPGLQALTAAFDYPDPAPAPGSVPVAARVDDPSGRYLPRAFDLELPRDPALAPTDPESLFAPVEVQLYPSPLASVPGSWASVRASVLDDATGDPVEGALVRVVRPGATPELDVVLARGLSDARGEAFVPVPGIPVMTWGDDETAVLTDEVLVRIEAFADPEASRPANPDDIEAARAALPFDENAGVALIAGRCTTQTLRLEPRP